MAEYTPLWLALVAAYRKARIAQPSLKAVTLAQWGHESRWGTSNLALLHNNFGGLNYRPHMRWYARPVAYTSSDGERTYCHFRNPKAFIRGYWRFVDRDRYRGWQDHGHDPMGYIDHIVACGYATDRTYRGKVVIAYEQVLADFPELLPEVAR